MNTQPSRLSERTMLIDFTASRWTARRKDKEVSDEVARQHNTTKKAGNYRKNLLPFEAPTYEAIGSIISKARAYHRENTLPWSDGDLRILPTDNFMQYMARMRELQVEFETAVDMFIPDALQADTGLFARAQKELNGLWKAEDYPNAARLRARHGFAVKRYPMPDAEDFRATLAQQDVDEIRGEIEQNVEQVKAAAMRDLWDRLYESVKHFVDIMQDPKAKITSALFDNMSELCDLLPRMNISDDPRLTQMATTVREKLTQYSPKYLGGRTNRTKRSKVAVEAERIRSQMAAYMGK